MWREAWSSLAQHLEGGDLNLSKRKQNIQSFEGESVLVPPTHVKHEDCVSARTHLNSIWAPILKENYNMMPLLFVSFLQIGLQSSWSLQMVANQEINHWKYFSM